MNKYVFSALLFFTFASQVIAQTHTSSVTIDRGNEVLFKLEDSGGDYTGFWTMNDGVGNMAIKLGIDGDGKYVVDNDGASEILWGAHNQNGYISLNAAGGGISGNTVSYGISMIVDGAENVLRVGAPNNARGGIETTGYKFADTNGNLFAGLSAGESDISDTGTFGVGKGLFVGNAGSILDNDDSSLNIVSRNDLSFYVNEKIGNSIKAAFIDEDGKIGIGTDSPQSSLHVTNGAIVVQDGYSTRGTINTDYERLRLSGNTSDYIVSVQDGTGRVQQYWNASVGTNPTYLVSNEPAGKILFHPDSDAFFTISHAPSGTAGSAISWNEYFRIKDDGNVGIGTTSPTQKLTVAGTINSQEIIVEEDAGADFVFESGYDLPTLPEVEAFVSQNNHLPGIAPASEMIENGVKVGELQMQLLQKIEELTLYTIKQQQLILDQNTLITDLQKRIETLEKEN